MPPRHRKEIADEVNSSELDDSRKQIAEKDSPCPQWLLTRYAALEEELRPTAGVGVNLAPAAVR